MLNDDKKIKAIISIEKVYAPFLGDCSPIINRLKRTGVIGNDNNMNEQAVVILAASFASNFYDRLLVYHNESAEEIITVFSAIAVLWQQKDFIGMYYFILMNCSLMRYPVPKELLWIAHRRDILLKYIQKFVELEIEFAKREPIFNNGYMEGES